MTFAYSLRPAVACAILVALTAPARADLLTSFSWSPSPSSVTAGGGGKVLFGSQTYAVHFGGTSDVDAIAARLTVVSTASASAPDRFKPSEGNYSLLLTLAEGDPANPGPSKSLVFTGQLQGAFSSANNALENAFTSPASQSLVLGAHKYTVTLEPHLYIPSTDQGYFVAHIHVDDVREAPEPAGLALLAVGGACCGLVRLTRRGSKKPSL